MFTWMWVNETRPNFATCMVVSQISEWMSNIWRFYAHKMRGPKTAHFPVVSRWHLSTNIFRIKCAEFKLIKFVNCALCSVPYRPQNLVNFGAEKAEITWLTFTHPECDWCREAGTAPHCYTSSFSVYIVQCHTRCADTNSNFAFLVILSPTTTAEQRRL